MQWGKLLLVGCLLAACGGAQRGARGDAALGPLIDLVPPGPSWLLQARPRALAEQQGALEMWRSLVTDEREQAFADRTGVAPRAVDELVAWELKPDGYVLLVRGPFDARDVVRRAGERLAVPDVRSDEPVVRREGLAGQGRYAYAALSERALLVAKNAPPDLVGEVLARRDDHASPRPRALEGPDARALLAEHAADPLLIVAPVPLAFDPGTQVSLLFARERAMAVTVRPTHTTLGVAIDLRGEFPPGVERNFRALAQSLAGTELGRALGLARVPERMAVRADDQGAYITFALEVNDLVAGVRLLFVDDMRQLFGSLRDVRGGATSCAHGEDRGSFPGRRPGGVSGARRGRSGRDRVEGHRG